ncbi:MAG: hypothetical protein ABSH19_02215 [Opitutales bacterium]|jgi:hypothetical protein
MNALPKTLAALVACAASAAVGYWYGTSKINSPSAASAASAAGVHAASASGPGSAASAAAAGLNITDLLNGATGAQAAQLLEKLAKSDPAALAAWAKTLSPDKCAALLALLKGQPANSLLSSVLDAVVNSWATQDPKGFLGSAQGVGVPKVREDGMDAALKALASTDPKAALDWIKQNPGTASTKALQARYDAAIAGYAATDPQGAFATVMALGEDTQRDRQMKSSALHSLANTLADSGSFTDAATMFAQLPAGQSQSDAYSTLAQRWAEADPQSASAWVATITDPAARSQASLSVVNAWAANDPASAAAWAAQVDQQNNAAGNPGQNSQQLLAAAVRDWANYDLDAPGQFLNQLPASPDKDTAVGIFALRAAQEDPQSAEQWVSTISDPGMQSRISMGVAFQELQQDPGNFSAFVANDTLMNDQQKQMLQNLPPNIMQNMNQFNNMMGGADAAQNMFENMMINGGGPFGGGGGRGFGGGGGGPGGPGGGGGGGG